MENRKIDYFIGFLICLITNIIYFTLPVNFVNILTLIIASCVFALIFGEVTNFIFKKRKK